MLSARYAAPFPPLPHASPTTTTQVALIAEEISGIGNEIQRQLLRTRRSFTSTVLSADGERGQGGGETIKGGGLCGWDQGGKSRRVCGVCVRAC